MGSRRAGDVGRPVKVAERFVEPELANGRWGSYVLKHFPGTSRAVLEAAAAGWRRRRRDGRPRVGREHAVRDMGRRVKPRYELRRRPGTARAIALVSRTVRARTSAEALRKTRDGEFEPLLGRDERLLRLRATAKRDAADASVELRYVIGRRRARPRDQGPAIER